MIRNVVLKTSFADYCTIIRRELVEDFANHIGRCVYGNNSRVEPDKTRRYLTYLVYLPDEKEPLMEVRCVGEKRQEFAHRRHPWLYQAFTVRQIHLQIRDWQGSLTKGKILVAKRTFRAA